MEGLHCGHFYHRGWRMGPKTAAGEAGREGLGKQYGWTVPGGAQRGCSKVPKLESLARSAVTSTLGTCKKLRFGHH